jgi:hypothetical protein
MTKRISVLFALAFLLSANLNAQVTIGELVEPAKGALLDLNKATKGGLALSNVDLDNFYTIPNGFPGIVTQTDVTEPVKTAFKGALVYNTGVTSPPAGIYVWNGTNWAPVKENCQPLTSSNLTLTALSPAEVNTNISFSASVNTSDICSGEERYEWYKNVGGSTAYGTYPFATTANATTQFATLGPYKVKVVVTNRYTDPATAVPAEKEMTVNVTATGGISPNKLSSNYGLVGEACLDVKKSKQPATQSDAAFAARIDAFAGDNYEKTYKFIHRYAYSGLSLNYEDPENLVKEIVPPPPSASAAGTAVDGYYEEEFKIKFESNIQDLVSPNGDPSTVKLLASYKDSGGADKQAYLEIRVEDGICVCPAQINATEWMNFMCHNLGGLDIISPLQITTRAHHGDWYRFGAKTASMENTEYHDTNNDWNDSNYQDSDDHWKPANNPCPAGWRLPTRAEYEGVTYNNSGQYDGSTTEPTDAGTYAIIVDIAEGDNYTAATGLYLGNFVIQ